MKRSILTYSLSVLSGVLFYYGPLYAEEATTEATSETTYQGTISTLDPTTSAISIEAPGGTKKYVYSKDTQFVDSEGRTITSTEVHQGVPVTIYYEPEGDRVIVKKVQVRQPAATRVEETTTTTTKHEKD